MSVNSGDREDRIGAACMPLIPYVCPNGHRASKMYKFRPDAPVTLACTECAETMKRAFGTPSSTSVVTVDNGIQAKAVEVNLEVVESNKENAKKDFREK